MIRHGDPDRKGQAKDERKPIPRYVSLIHHAASCSTNSCWNPLPDVPSGDAEQFRDSSLIFTIPELPGSGWLAAEPEATPQTHRLRPWGFPPVSPSHPSVFPHHGIQRITVEFSEKSRTIVTIILAVTKVAGDLPSVFGIIGASFGPICGAMAADYLLAGKRWSGPRAGFNAAGWVAWALGFLVGILPNLHGRFPAIPDVPAAPVAAFIVGFAVYFACAKIGLISPVISMPNRADVS